MDKTERRKARAVASDMLMVEVGDSGLNRWGGSIGEEFLPQLRGARAVKTFNEMRRNDDSIGPMLRIVTLYCRNVPLHFRPADAEDGDAEYAEEIASFVESCFDDMSCSFDQFFTDILSMLWAGFAPLEIVYKTRRGVTSDPPSKFDDGMIGWRKMSLRGQETVIEWIFDDNGGLKGLKQQTQSGKVIEIPIEKLLLFRVETEKNNPEGISLLRNAYRPWFFKKRFEELLAIGVERDLAGLPVARIPADYMSDSSTPGQKALFEYMKKLVTRIKRDEQEGVVLPSDRDEKGNPLFELSLMTTGGRRQFDVDKLIERFDVRILMQIFADFLMLGHERTGSFALSDSKTDVFALAVASVVNSIIEVLNRYALPRLMQINAIDQKYTPYIEAGDIETPSIADVVSIVDALTRGGSTSMMEDGGELENALRRMVNLPPKEVEGAL